MSELLLVFMASGLVCVVLLEIAMLRAMTLLHNSIDAWLDRWLDRQTQDQPYTPQVTVYRNGREVTVWREDGKR